MHKEWMETREILKARVRDSLSDTARRVMTECVDMRTGELEVKRATVATVKALQRRMREQEEKSGEYQRLLTQVHDALIGWADPGEKMVEAIKRLRANQCCTEMRAKSAEAVAGMGYSANGPSWAERALKAEKEARELRSLIVVLREKDLERLCGSVQPVHVVLPDHDEVRDTIGEVIGIVQARAEKDDEGARHFPDIAVERLKWVREKIAAWGRGA